MASVMKDFDDDRYKKALELILERSTREKCLIDFIRNTLSDVLASIGNGKSQLNVIGVGSGNGQFDLEILFQLCLKHPGVLVDNEAVEPSSHMLDAFRAKVDQKLDLDHIQFTWDLMTASEFEEHWRQKNITKKADFIHMLQVLYYVTDPEATIRFFQSLLDKNGKLMIVLGSDQGGWGKVTKTFRGQLPSTENMLTSTDIRKLLDAGGVSYQRHELWYHTDITDCFTEGDEAGSLLLDFITHTQNFSLTASPELRQEVVKLLRGPQCSEERDGRILFKSHTEILMLDAIID